MCEQMIDIILIYDKSIRYIISTITPLAILIHAVTIWEILNGISQFDCEQRRLDIAEQFQWLPRAENAEALVDAVAETEIMAGDLSHELDPH